MQEGFCSETHLVPGWLFFSLFIVVIPPKKLIKTFIGGVCAVDPSGTADKDE